jgi:hypothetical protein
LKHQPLSKCHGTVCDANLFLPESSPSPDSIACLVSLSMPDLMIQEAERLSRLAQSKQSEPRDPDNPQLH